MKETIEGLDWMSAETKAKPSRNSRPSSTEVLEESEVEG